MGIHAARVAAEEFKSGRSTSALTDEEGRDPSNFPFLLFAHVTRLLNYKVSVLGRQGWDSSGRFALAKFRIIQENSSVWQESIFQLKVVVLSM